MSLKSLVLSRSDNHSSSLRQTNDGKNYLLAQLEAPLTSYVPWNEIEIPKKDFWLRVTKLHEPGFSFLFYMGGLLNCLLALLSFGMTSAGEVSLTVGAPLMSLSAALFMAGFYLAGLTYGHQRRTNLLFRWIYTHRLKGVRKRQLRKASRQARRLDGRGWRPRHGVPHPEGRTDTYDRWLIEAHMTDKGVAVGLRRWYCSNERIWQPVGILEDPQFFPDTQDSVALIGEYRALLEAKVINKEKKARSEDEDKELARQVKAEEADLSNRILVEHINASAVASA